MKVVMGLVQQHSHIIEDPSSFCACSLTSHSCWVLSPGFSPLDCNVAAIAPDITSSEVNKKGRLYKQEGKERHCCYHFSEEKNLSQTALTPAIESPLLAWKWSHAHCRPVTDKKMELPWFSDIMSHSEQNWSSISWERGNDCSVHAQQYLPHASNTNKLYWPLTENCSN